MENRRYNTCGNREMKEKKSGGSFLGFILITIGIIWLLKETGWHVGLPGWGMLQESTSDFFNIFHFGAWSVTWPVILLVVGVVLIAGRRLIGAFLIVFALLLFLPVIIVPGIIAMLFFPVVLVIAGIIIISKIRQ